MRSPHALAALGLSYLAASVAAAPAAPIQVVVEQRAVDQSLIVNTTNDAFNGAFNATSSSAAPVQVVVEQRAVDQPLTVNTTSGAFNGAFNANTGVYRYLGIPYAETTGGQNRFKAPVPKAYGNQTGSATNFSPSCPQWITRKSVVSLKLSGQDVEGYGEDEDCLTVNTWVGKNVRENAGTGTGAPIVVWFYGGGYTTGTSSLPIYSLENFVAKNPDVIAISVNYRVNIFGFPSSPQLINTGPGTNLGFLDRDFAIDWIHRNAAAFGGDPNAITLQGQSAGGAAVDTWAYSHSGQDGFPSAQGTGVRGFIIQSGVAQGLDFLVAPTVLPTPSASNSGWNTVAQEVGCGTNSDEAQLACMRSVPWQTIKAALISKSPQIGPYADQKTWFNDFRARSVAGKFAKLPTLLGTDESEGTILTATSLDKSPNGTEVAPLITTVGFRCPAADNERSRTANGVPVWRYFYSGNWDNVNCGRPSLGAYHSSEIAMVFSNYGPTPQCDATGSTDPSLARPVVVPPEEDATSAFMSKSWATFVKDPQNGLTSAGWPRYRTPFDRTVAQISANNSGKVDFITPVSLSYDCVITNDVLGTLANVLKQVGGPFGITLQSI